MTASWWRCARTGKSTRRRRAHARSEPSTALPRNQFMDGVDQPVLTDDPVRVRGEFDAPSRWLCLFKWCVLAAPHYPILILLYLAYPLVTVVAGIAILFTGRYPRSLFEFNVGVLRWSGRVMNIDFR